MRFLIVIIIMVCFSCKNENSFLDANHTKSGRLLSDESLLKDFENQENYNAFVRATFAHRNENYSESLETIKELHSKEPNNYLVLTSLALNFCAMKNYADADSIYEIIMSDFSHKQGGAINYSSCLSDQNKFDDAIKVLKNEIRNYYPDLSSIETSSKSYYAGIRFNLAVAYKKKKDCKNSLLNAEFGLQQVNTTFLKEALEEIKGEMENCD